MMEIFLINPPLSFVYGFKKDISSVLPPMGLLSIASSLREHNHKVKFFDLEFHEDSVSLFNNIKNASIVGITLTTPSFIFAAEIAKKIKSINPNCLIIGGGWHVNHDTWDVVLDFDFDILVFGEGEYVFNGIIEFFERAGNMNSDYLDSHAPNELKNGIAIKTKKGKKLYSGQNIISDIDSLPIPAYDLVDWRKYKPSAHRDLGFPFLPIITARGCPFSCRYCANNGNWRLHSIDYIRNLLTEASLLFNQRIKNLIVWDDTFTIPRKRVKEITEMLLTFKLNFSINTHPNAVDGSILQLLKNAGCKIIFFGIESNDKKILKKLGRNTSIESLKKAIELTSRNGILSSGSVMIGTPYDTEKTIESNVTFLKNEIKPDLCFFSPFSIEPGTELYKELVSNEDIFPYNDWYDFYKSDNEEFSIVPPAYIPSSNRHLSKAAVYEKVKWAYNYFYDSNQISLLESKTKFHPQLEDILFRIKNRNKN